MVGADGRKTAGRFRRTRLLFPPPPGFPCETATPAMYPSPASAGEVAPDLSRADGGVRPACAGSAPHVCRRRTPARPPPLKRILLQKGPDAGKRTDRSTYSVFFAPRRPSKSPETRRNAGKLRFGGAAKTILIGNFPASRPSGSALYTKGGIAGRHGPAEAEGRTGQGPAVKPRRRKGRRTQPRTGWRIGWGIG